MPALYLEARPTMAFAYDHEAEFWGALINPDKSPSPLLEQLCLGIAQLMVSVLDRLLARVGDGKAYIATDYV